MTGKAVRFQLLISVTQIVVFGIIFTNTVEHIAWRVSISCVLSLSISCVPVCFLVNITYGPMLNDFCFYFL